MNDAKIDARRAAEHAMEYLADMTGQEPEVVISVQPEEDRWLVEVELLELARIPNATDILGLYEVELNNNGEPRSFRRTRRYHRGQVGEVV